MPVPHNGCSSNSFSGNAHSSARLHTTVPRHSLPHVGARCLPLPPSIFRIRKARHPPGYPPSPVHGRGPHRNARRGEGTPLKSPLAAHRSLITDPSLCAVAPAFSRLPIPEPPASPPLPVLLTGDPGLLGLRSLKGEGGWTPLSLPLPDPRPTPLPLQFHALMLPLLASLRLCVRCLSRLPVRRHRHARAP